MTSNRDLNADYLRAIPKHWTVAGLTKHLESLVDYRGATPEKVDHGVFLVTAANIRNGTIDYQASQEFVRADEYEEIMRRGKPHIGDVLFTTEAPLGQVAQVDREDIALAQRIVKLRARSDAINSRFLVYWMLSMPFQHQLYTWATGSTALGIKAEKLHKLQVVIPPQNEQRAIVKYLDRETARIDGLVEAKKRVLGLLAEKQRALIARAVTRGLDSRTPLCDSGIPWLGEIPAHWQTRRVAWLFRERDERGEPDLPLLEVSINAGVALREFSADRIESTAADFNSYKVARQSDVVFNKMRMWQGAVGVAPEDGLVSPDYTVATPSGTLLPEYAGQLFRTELFSAECARRSHGIVWDRLRLYWDGFRDIELPLPPQNEQRIILDHIEKETDKLDALRAATERTIALLRERRAALIAAAVTGQIAIPEKNKTSMECQNAI